MTVAIIGRGVVGRAQARLFGDVLTYDITDDGPYPAEKISRCQFAVIAVGTPSAPDGRADLNAVWSAVRAVPYRLPVMVRSTLPPGTSHDLLRVRAPSLYAHVPEFLHERAGGPWQESGDVPFMLLGGSPAAQRFFRPLLEKAYTGNIRECTTMQAELAKYTANLHWAARVTFVNELASICARFGVSWETVRQLWLLDPRNTPAYTAMDGFPPGYGGACWPKDLAALIAASSDAGYEPEFLRAIEVANARFRGEP